MKKNHPRLGILRSLVFGCVALSVVNGCHRKTPARAKHEDAVVSHAETPKAAANWKVIQGNQDGSVPERLELFVGPSECAYVERWSKEISPRFIVFLIDYGDSTLIKQAPRAPEADLIDGYDSLQTAMQATEQICARP